MVGTDTMTPKSRRGWIFDLLLVALIGAGMSCSSSKVENDASSPSDANDASSPSDANDASSPSDANDASSPSDISDTSTAGDGRADSTDAGGPCALIVGRTFESVNVMECGVGGASGSTSLCAWTIQFRTDGTYNWRHSDIYEQGSYRCEGGALIVQPSNNGAPVTASYNTATGHLTWRGVDYVAAP
jgi:hypothetical protein